MNASCYLKKNDVIQPKDYGLILSKKTYIEIPVQDFTFHSNLLFLLLSCVV